MGEIKELKRYYESINEFIASSTHSLQVKPNDYRDLNIIMSPLNESTIYDDVEGIKMSTRQRARKHRENESLKQIEEWKRKEPHKGISDEDIEK